MRVTLGDRTLVIGWAYRNSELKLASTDTICKISEVNPDGSLTEIVRGKASCSLTDTFKKEPGRKLSLQRALLTKVQNPMNPAAEWVPLFPEPVRVRVWQEYFQSRGAALPKELVRE